MEHPWLKFYPWKDLYNKSVESPFKHNILEPWDQKYVNAPDKLGLETRERYESIIKSEKYKYSFDDYYFYLNPNDNNDNYNNSLKILPCAHDKLKNQDAKILLAPSYSSDAMLRKNDGTAGEIKVMNNYEGKFVKTKQLSSVDLGTSKYKQIKVSGGTSNINNKILIGNQNMSIKSNIKASVGSNNSTSTSNQLGNNSSMGK
jgi:hypothetical protein